MSIFRLLGSTLSSVLFLPVMSVFGINKSMRSRYWIQIQSAQDMVNIPSKIIQVSFGQSFWKTPIFNSIFQSKLPIAMI